MQRSEHFAINPACPPGAICVVFSADANYAPYLGAALASLAAAASPGNFYDVIVLASGIDAAEQEKIGAAIGGANNISLRFFDVRERLEQQAGNFFVNAHLSPAAYYRLFVPSIFENFQKILYLDCDIIVLEDVAALYRQDLEGRAAGAARDFFAIADLASRNSRAWAKQLGMRDTERYFNSGVLLFDLEKLRTKGYEEKWFQRLRAVKNPRLHDQDILNHSLEGDVRLLEAAWNSPAWLASLGESLESCELSEALFADYLAAAKSPKIIHYATRHKPWELPHLPLAEHFWANAARTPYYQALIFNCIKRLGAENDMFKGRLRLPPVGLKHFFYALMGRLVPGKSGARFRAKARRIHYMNPGLKKSLRSWH